MFKVLGAVVGGALVALGGCGAPIGETDEVIVTESALSAAKNPRGVAETVHSTGVIDRNNPFFQVLGPNPRTCESCHAASQGWTITASATAQAFRASEGLAPLFMPHDAGGRPDADLSTLEGRRAAFRATLVKRGLIRFSRTLPATSEFVVMALFDPAGFATPTQITNFRRPTPTANESKVANMLWTAGPHDVPTQIFNTASGAARFHGQRPGALLPEQAAAVRDFQLGIIFAQKYDNDARALDADGATGGPANLAAQPFHIGVNDIQGGDPTGQPFNAKVFDLYDSWAAYDSLHPHHSGDACDDEGSSAFERECHDHVVAARAAIYRGQEIFNGFEFDIRGVHGLNDLLGQETVRGTCSTCHNSPNIGAHSVFRMFDVGTADPPNCSADLPLLTLQNKTTGVVRQTCDMGRGANGAWADVGSFRAPPLRGLAARAPYFHDGQAATIRQVIQYFDRRFSIGLTRHQKRDLEAFLGAL